MAVKTVYITGANCSYFPVICSFLQSFGEWCNDERLYVCDFGLSAEQQDFFSRKGILLPRPSGLAAGLHPFYYKASLLLYLEPLQFDIVVWVDCDCLVVGPVGVRVDRWAAQFGKDETFLGVCPDCSDSVKDFIERVKTRRVDASPFRQLMVDAGLALDGLYLNSAFFILRCRDFLSEWFALSFEIDCHVLFEQNVFNYLAYKGLTGVYMLNRDTWNVHDLSLNRLAVVEDNNRRDRVYLDGKRVLIVHATSLDGRASFGQGMTMEVGGVRMQGVFRLVRHPEIQRLQIGSFGKYVQTNRDLLLECGAVEPCG